MTTNEHILNDHGPSLKLPWSPNPFETAGRTYSIDSPWIKVRCCCDENRLELKIEMLHTHVVLDLNTETYQYHRRGPSNRKDGTNKGHLSIPSCRPALRHWLWPHKWLPKLRKGRRWRFRFASRFGCFRDCWFGICFPGFCSTGWQEALSYILFQGIDGINCSRRTWTMSVTESLQPAMIPLDQALPRKW